VLEARFHPWRKARGPFVVVGRILCRRRRALVLPAPAADESEGARHETMVHKLEYLVARCGRDTFHRLLDLPSDFWSFVEVQPPGEVLRPW
jgi:hypothetical protein